jgi:hypothetical protein
LAELNQLASNHISTEEFIKELMQTDSYMKNWGELSNADFTSKLSEAVLDTPLVGDNLTYWVDQLDQNVISRDDMLLIAVGVVSYQDMLFAGDGLLLS